MARAPHALMNNWRLKLSALGLSVFLWALVQNEPLSQETFSAVPVSVDISDTAWTTAGAPTPATVELRLGGPARELIRLAREGTTVRVPVSSVGSRDTLIALQREWVQLGQRAGLTVESLSPLTLAVSFEPAVTRSIPVSIRVQGELPSGLALSSELGINPETVSVHGPETRLLGLDSIPLRPFALSGVRASGAFTLAVDTSGLGGASVEPPDVMLGVHVEPILERVLDGIAVQADTRPGEAVVVVTPSSIQIRLAGARTLVTAMDLSLLRVSVAPESLVGMQPNEMRRVRLQVDGLPPLVAAYPSTEVVTVRRADPTDAADRNQP